MLFRTRGTGKASSLWAGANPPRRRAAVMAGVLASVSAVALGTASAASQGSEEPTTAAVQAVPAADSAREHWQPPTVRSDGPEDPHPGKINTDYLISEVSPAQFRGYWYQSHVKGVSVTWVAPSGRDPYNGWDWIEIQDSNGKRVTWDWACGNANCGAYGSTLIDANLTKGAEYKALYYSDGGRVTRGTLQAEFEFWA
ncbi:hypothetical protein [Streptomyces sp. NBC_01445]|uniref:hypothetical protein n=2 Tax=unclassified Streptomyces TaxID=2593676 RepID=UPI002DD8EE60|nr:hypothetical protein [Streptomyces sp. NBC_01445]WSE02690.1 hypothetical protein OG574_04410 [Streptomyces sp. NBC_01445]